MTPAKFRDRRLALVVAPISEGTLISMGPGGQDEPATVACGICGFGMNEAGECASPAGDGDRVADWLEHAAGEAGEVE